MVGASPPCQGVSSLNAHCKGAARAVRSTGMCSLLWPCLGRLVLGVECTSKKRCAACLPRTEVCTPKKQEFFPTLCPLRMLNVPFKPIGVLEPNWTLHEGVTKLLAFATSQPSTVSPAACLLDSSSVLKKRGRDAIKIGADSHLTSTWMSRWFGTQVNRHGYPPLPSVKEQWSFHSMTPRTA